MYMNIVIIASVVLQTLHFWLIRKGKLSYPLILIIYGLYMVVEGWLASRDPSQKMLWLYVGLNGWAMYCAAEGWRRMNQKDKQ